MRLSHTVFAAVAVCVLAGSAWAGTVDVAHMGQGAGRNFRVQLHDQDYAGEIFAGQLLHEFANGTGQGGSLDGQYVTYCTELVQLATSDTTEYAYTALSDAPSTGPMGAARAQALRELFAYAEGRQFVESDTSDNSRFAAAFQIAVWEVVYDYDGSPESLDVAGGSLQVTRLSGSALGSGIQTVLNEMFGAVGSGATMPGLMAVTHRSFQDQLVLIPLPAAAMMGLVGLSAVAWRRRRSSQAT